MHLLINTLHFVCDSFVCHFVPLKRWPLHLALTSWFGGWEADTKTELLSIARGETNLSPVVSVVMCQRSALADGTTERFFPLSVFKTVYNNIDNLCLLFFTRFRIGLR